MHILEVWLVSGIYLQIPCKKMITIIITMFILTFLSHTRKTFNRFTTKTAMLGTSHIIRKVLQYET